MNKQELVTAATGRTGLTQKDMRIALDALLETAVEALSQGERITLVGFGSLESRLAPARRLLLPDGRETSLPQRRSLAFHPGKELREAMNPSR